MATDLKRIGAGLATGVAVFPITPTVIAVAAIRKRKKGKNNKEANSVSKQTVRRIGTGRVQRMDPPMVTKESPAVSQSEKNLPQHNMNERIEQITELSAAIDETLDQLEYSEFIAGQEEEEKRGFLKPALAVGAAGALAGSGYGAVKAARIARQVKAVKPDATMREIGTVVGRRAKRRFTDVGERAKNFLPDMDGYGGFKTKLRQLRNIRNKRLTEVGGGIAAGRNRRGYSLSDASEDVVELADMREAMARKKGQRLDQNELRGAMSGGGIGIANAHGYTKAGKIYRNRDAVRDSAVAGVGGAAVGSGIYAAGHHDKIYDRRLGKVLRKTPVAVVAGLAAGVGAGLGAGKLALRKRVADDRRA